MLFFCFSVRPRLSASEFNSRPRSQKQLVSRRNTKQFSARVQTTKHENVHSCLQRDEKVQDSTMQTLELWLLNTAATDFMRGWKYRLHRLTRAFCFSVKERYDVSRWWLDYKVPNTCRCSSNLLPTGSGSKRKSFQSNNWGLHAVRLFKMKFHKSLSSLPTTSSFIFGVLLDFEWYFNNKYGFLTFRL